MITPDKSFGQHFLHNKSILEKIVQQAELGANDCVLEIGPGTGNLTRVILEKDIARLYAIEKDARFLPMLDELKSNYPDRFEYVITDATTFDFAPFCSYKLIANLPYNIAGYLFKLWIHRPQTFVRYVITIQREMADRILAAPDSKTYGKLSILMQTQFHIHQALHIKNTSFFPAPKVNSTVLMLMARNQNIAPGVFKTLCALLELVFSSRRKKMYNLLRQRYSEQELLVLKSFDLQKRPENFSPADYLEMATSLHGTSANTSATKDQ